jgi:hypothetical protein
MEIFMSRSEFCRTQQAHHQARSISESLQNTRKIALAAATAWGREADLALVVELRRGQMNLDDGDAAIAEEFRAEQAAEA